MLTRLMLLIFSILIFTRGILCESSSGKFTLQFVGGIPGQGDNTVNSISVSKGRYSPAFFKVTGTASADETIVVSITTTGFKTDSASYTIDSSVKTPIPIWIGALCQKDEGEYTATLTVNGATNWEAFSSITITVKSGAGVILLIDSAIAVAKGGSGWVGVKVTELPINPVTIKFTRSSGSDKATLSEVTIPAKSTDKVNAVFSITDVTVVGEQIFTLSTDNACFEVNSSSDSVTVTVDNTVLPTFDSSLDLTSRFAYDTIGIELTDIKFIFTPPISSMYMYCVLTCFNIAFPSDSDIKSANQGMNTDLIRYWNSYIGSGDPVSIIISNLNRSQIYKMKCIATTSEGNAGSRTEKTAEINESKAGVSLAPSPITQTTQCITYSFTDTVSTEVKQSILNYCSRTLSNEKFEEYGCIICTDSKKSQVAPSGYALPSTCFASTASAKRFRFLATAEKWVMCAVPSGSCKTNPKSSFEDDVTSLVAYTSSSTNLAQIVKDETGRTVTVPIDTTTPPYEIDMNSAPDISTVTATIGTWDATGVWAFTATFPEELQCYVGIDTAAYSTADSIVKCTDTAWCSNKIVSGQVTWNHANLKAFTKGSKYFVSITCKSTLPGASKWTAVMTLGEYTVPADPTCEDATKIYPDCHAYSLTLSSLFLIFISALIFA